MTRGPFGSVGELEDASRDLATRSEAPDDYLCDLLRLLPALHGQLRRSLPRCRRH